LIRKIVSATVARVLRSRRKIASPSSADGSIANQCQHAEVSESLLQRLAYIRKMRDNERGVQQASDAPKPSGFAAVGIFLFLGATLASLAAITLLWRGTSLDRIWSLNPNAYTQLAPLGWSVGALFFLLGVALAVAGVGWFRRRLWGWRLAVAIITIQIVGDVINCVRGDWLHGGIGVVIAAALLLFLLRPTVRKAFA
jgi:hypothetical protein